MISRWPGRRSSKPAAARLCKPTVVSSVHIAAQMAGDTAGAVSVSTDDVEHDMVGSPAGPSTVLDGGSIAAQLTAA